MTTTITATATTTPANRKWKIMFSKRLFPTELTTIEKLKTKNKEKTDNWNAGNPQSGCGYFVHQTHKLTEKVKKNPQGREKIVSHQPDSKCKKLETQLSQHHQSIVHFMRVQ